VATTTGRGIGALYALSRLVRPGGRVAVRRRDLGFDARVMGRLLRLSGAGALQALIGSASWIGLVRIASTFGSSVLAGYTIGIRVVVFALLPSWGLSNAAATMVGQALGAGRPERAARAVHLTGLYNCGVLAVVGAVFVAFAHPIVGLFTTDPDVLRTGTDCLRVIAFGFPFFAWGMVVTQAFNGAGDTWTPTWLNFVIFWLWEIPLAYVLAIPLHGGPRGIFAAVSIAFSTLAVAASLLFRQGRWKGISV
jgi:Na+-driven multidrug efflux pump